MICACCIRFLPGVYTIETAMNTLRNGELVTTFKRIYTTMIFAFSKLYTNTEKLQITCNNDNNNIKIEVKLIIISTCHQILSE